jgi:hypothetical protein
MKTIDLEKHRARVADLDCRIEKAEGIQSVITGLRDDLARAERRRDAFASYGPERILIPQPEAHFDGLVIAVEPLRSRQTGDELATLIQEGEIGPINSEIGRLADELKSLLAG